MGAAVVSTSRLRWGWGGRSHRKATEKVSTLRMIARLEDVANQLLRMQATHLASEVDTRVDPEDFWRSFRFELERARRHERPLALVSFRTHDNSAASSDLIAHLAQSLRIHDGIMAERSDVVVLLSETDAVAAAAAAQRLLQAANGLLGSAPRCSAVFPEDGWTTSALIESLYRDRSSSSRRDVAS